MTELIDSSNSSGTQIVLSATTEKLLCELLANIMGVEQVSADSHFFDELGADSMVMTRFCARLRKREELPSPSIKEVYKYPTISCLAAALAEDTPSKTEQILCELLANIMGVEQVSADSHFFDELGADSMVMARFCARLRKRDDLPSVSMKEVYEHSTISRLAQTYTNTSTSSGSKSDETLPPTIVQFEANSTAPIGTPGIVLCGLLQFLSAGAYLYLFISILAQGTEFIFIGTNFIDLFLRSLLVGVGLLLALSIIPILLKWLLIGRWKPKQIRIWSLEYFRFWLVKSLIRANPLIAFAGSPLYIIYLRALGAKIGRNVVIFSRHVPVCTDLLKIGDNSVIRKDALFSCYQAHNGLIQIGSVTLGKNVYIDVKTVLDIDTSMGDGAQLGHSSSLTIGQSIPNGEHRTGSPARQRTNVNYQRVDPMSCSILRKVIFSTLQLLIMFVIPSLIYSIIIFLVPFVSDILSSISPDSPALTQRAFYINALIQSFVLLFGSTLIGLLIVGTIPRLLNLIFKVDKVYPLYGLHYWVHQMIRRMTNIKFFIHLFGDSSYIVYYLRWLGYDFSNGILQTGSNFGSELKHDTPFLVSVGRGTMVADGLSSINANFSNSSFMLSQVKIGPNNFLGNQVVYPAQGKTGNNCLLASKVMIPVDGEIREGVGLLGSPSFEIPRSVMRDKGLNNSKVNEGESPHLTAKNWYNLFTMGLFLLGQWGLSFGLVILLYASALFYQTTGAFGYLIALLIGLNFRIYYKILMERSVISFGKLQPQECSIYNPYFWFHERYWKFAVLPANLNFLNGTPFKNIAWRLLGVQIGKGVFDDGCVITEKTMVSIGDNCTLNVGSVIQSHSQEDGGFKSDQIIIGAGCTLGINSLVHYGTKIGDGAELAADTFLMKGEQVPPNTRWGDNPAREVGSKHSGPSGTAGKETFWQATVGSNGHGHTKKNEDLKKQTV